MTEMVSRRWLPMSDSDMACKEEERNRMINLKMKSKMWSIPVTCIVQLFYVLLPTSALLHCYLGQASKHQPHQSSIENPRKYTIS